MRGRAAKCGTGDTAMALRAPGPLPAQGNCKLSGVVAHATYANLKGSCRKVKSIRISELSRWLRVFGVSQSYDASNKW